MRFILGLIVGVLLTIGTAYVVDATRSGPGDDASRRMVNWTVVGSDLQAASDSVRAAWSRLLGKSDAIDRKTGV